MLSPFDRVQFTPSSLEEVSRQGNTLSERVSQTLRRVTSNPENDYVVQSVSLVTLTNNVVNHKLGRKPVGWALLDDTGGGIVRLTGVNDWTATTITLYSPATCTVSLKVW
jgi:hypothetical protein